MSWKDILKGLSPYESVTADERDEANWKQEETTHCCETAKTELLRLLIDAGEKVPLHQQVQEGIEYIEEGRTDCDSIKGFANYLLRLLKKPENTDFKGNATLLSGIEKIIQDWDKCDTELHNASVNQTR
jgi:hypothetical protein